MEEHFRTCWPASQLINDRKLVIDAVNEVCKADLTRTSVLGITRGRYHIPVYLSLLIFGMNGTFYRGQ